MNSGVPLSDEGFRSSVAPPSRSPISGELLDADARPARKRFQDQQWARLLSFWTDSVFEVPGLGWRFGLDPLIGLVPVVGDLASSAVSFYILSLAAHFGVPRRTLARMAINVGIDYVLGSIPLIGNVFDFAWKANQRNMALLEQALAAPAHERRRQTMVDWLIIGGTMVFSLRGFDRIGYRHCQLGSRTLRGKPMSTQKRLPALTPRARQVVNLIVNSVALGSHDNDAEIGALAAQLGTSPARLQIMLNKLQEQGWLTVESDFIYPTVEALRWQNPKLEERDARKMLRSLK
jgi:hypothetical protein